MRTDYVTSSTVPFENNENKIILNIQHWHPDQRDPKLWHSDGKLLVIAATIRSVFGRGGEALCEETSRIFAKLKKLHNSGFVHGHRRLQHCLYRCARSRLADRLWFRVAGEIKKRKCTHKGIGEVQVTEVGVGLKGSGLWNGTIFTHWLGRLFLIGTFAILLRLKVIMVYISATFWHQYCMEISWSDDTNDWKSWWERAHFDAHQRI